jgi:hypothetical protein
LAARIAAIGELFRELTPFLIKYHYISKVIGGETGIRTLGTFTRTTVFETAPFDHSGISPHVEGPWSNMP